ncbi:uncharacterized protein LOC113751144 isoform X1 [Coffea eugenioides]|uniref:uncharacterized protein LOC113751144 isoform X1 n=1 Tax=Coffea eugenioides TaxID=49369 RepID=UPI000F610450|nr:uncharacterized protein LOC113751144 isoform X1 [Coffea eugenioides]
METEDIISLPANSPGDGSEDNDYGCDPGKVDCQSGKLEVEEVKEIGEILGHSGDTADGDDQLLLATDNDKTMHDNPSSLEVSFELTETVAATCLSPVRHAGNGSLALKDESFLNNHNTDGFAVSSHEIVLSGAKRSRATVDEQQPSVQVTYKSLTRDSKRKLEELLQQWSQWHAQHCSSSKESSQVLESGEDTYFPALQVGVDKHSAVSFWMENETRCRQNKEVIPFDGNSVPVYDRGYSLALTAMDGSSNLGVLEVVEGSRCFNCGSYNHALKDCPKPRDNIAVNNARKQHKSRRNQNPSSRNPTRYYQNSPGGKYDGLKPGTLDSETRQLLGLGEFDPPPWLNRMREIGYPPGYLDPDNEDQPSGITIFGDEENGEDTEEGEILDSSHPEPARKMSIEFPGVNAPIPQNADEMRWAAGPSDLNMSRNRSYSRSNRTSDSGSRGHYHEQRLSRSFEDDEPPPPGCEVGSPSWSSYSHRYGGFEPGYSPRSPGDSRVPRSSSFDRSLSARARRSPVVHNDSLKHFPYGNLPYSSPR